MKSTRILAILVLALGLIASIANADFIFGTPTKLGPTVNSSAFDGSPEISADGLTLYFDSLRPGGLGNWDIYVTMRTDTNADWGTAEILPSPINSSYGDSGPCISPDGLALYFASDRPGGYGSYDIWVTTRETTNDPWGPPVNLGPIVNSSSYDNHPYISSDNLSLHFDSYRSFGGYGSADLYVTTRATKNSPWGKPINLGPTVNTHNREYSPCISTDGLTLLFERRTETRHIRLTTRTKTDDDWGTSVNLGPPVNTSSTYTDATDPSITVDGAMLYFVSDRPGGVGDADLWQVSISPVVDFNGDGIVDIKDLLRLIECWGQDEPSVDIGPTPFGDGIVDVQDLQVLMSYWQQEILPASMLAYWKLDETEGFIVADSTGNNDAYVYGPVWQPTGGKVDGALQFDGIDDFVITPFVLNPAEGPFSVFAWIKDGAAGQVVISQVGGADWLSADPSAGNLMTELQDTGWDARELLSQTVITDGVWHRVGLVWDGTNRTLYVDDVEVATDTQTGLAGATGGLYIGAGKSLDAGSFWSGLIDDVRIYNRAVSP